MFKNIKSLFITTDETVEQKKVESNQEEPLTNTPNEQNKVDFQKTSTVEMSSNEGDKSILVKLLKALEENNQPGFDYFEYKRSLKSLDKLPMDEATKFQSAFATAATMELTLDKLLNSIEFYKKVLKIEEDNFLKTSKEQITLNVENKRADVEKISNLIKEKGLKIQQLNEEIIGHQKRQEELSEFITNAENKIKITENNFRNALEILTNQMNDDMNKLKQYIK